MRFALALFLLIISPALAADKPPLDCEAVRAFVAEHGKLEAIAFAVKNGATWKQIRAASKCLRG